MTRCSEGVKKPLTKHQVIVTDASGFRINRIQPILWVLYSKIINICHYMVTGDYMKAVDQLIKDMQERPNDFCCDVFYMTDCKTNLVYWIANGFWFYQIHRPYNLDFGLIDKIKFHRALNKWKNAAAVQATKRIPL